MRQLIIVFLVALVISIVCASRSYWNQTHALREAMWEAPTSQRNRLLPTSSY